LNFGEHIIFITIFIAVASAVFAVVAPFTTVSMAAFIIASNFASPTFAPVAMTSNPLATF